MKRAWKWFVGIRANIMVMATGLSLYVLLWGLGMGLLDDVIVGQGWLWGLLYGLLLAFPVLVIVERAWRLGRAQGHGEGRDDVLGSKKYLDAVYGSGRRDGSEA